MRSSRFSIAVAVMLVVLPASMHAGLYYSGEVYAELPAQWRGFLLDQRLLRSIAVRPGDGKAPSPLRKHYESEVEKLTKLAQQRKLGKDEVADLGALYLRLGEPARAVEVLRLAQRDHPRHFRLAANLGTALQMQGDLTSAARVLDLSARLAPPKLREVEQLHVKLVRLRARQPREAQDLDDLFGIQYIGPSGKFEAGQLAAAQRERLPSDAIARVQQLALWLPSDGRLLWQLAELAGANGDVATAAAVMDGCVTEFGMRAPALREHRRAYRAAAADQAKSSTNATARHEGHTGLFKPRSPRPLARKLDQAPLPPIDPKGVNTLPWSVLAETTLDQKYQPTFPAYLKELDHKKVKLSGYLQPFGDDADLGDFMLVEYPIGCWYCEQPEMTGILHVELPEGKGYHYTRGLIHVSGTLILNASDPEKFLFKIRDAEISQDE